MTAQSASKISVISKGVSDFLKGIEYARRSVNKLCHFLVSIDFSSFKSQTVLGVDVRNASLCRHGGFQWRNAPVKVAQPFIKGFNLACKFFNKSLKSGFACNLNAKHQSSILWAEFKDFNQVAVRVNGHKCAICGNLKFARVNSLKEFLID